MRNFSLSKAISLFFQTSVFLPVRLLLGLGAVLGLVLAVTVGLAVEKSLLGPDVTSGLGTVIGLGLGLALWATGRLTLRGLILARIRLPHVAAVGEVMDAEGQVYGHEQISRARLTVRRRLGGAGALFRLERLLHQVVLGIASLVDDGVHADRTPATSGLRAFVRRLLRHLAADALTEAVVSHALRAPEENGWDNAHDGSVLLAQNAQHVLNRTGWIVLGGWVLALGLFALFVQPMAVLAGAITPLDAPGGLSVALALGLAYVLKVAIIDAVTLALVLQIFAAATRDQQPNAEWRGLLAHGLPAFRKLGEGAESWRPGQHDAVLADT